MKSLWPLRASAILAFSPLLTACLGMPGSTVTDAGTIVYTAGPKQDAVSVIFSANPDTVFDSVIHAITISDTTEVVVRDDASGIVEVATNGQNLRAEAVAHGNGETLLFVWTDAGNTGLTGNEVAMAMINAVSQDLSVPYEIVEN